VVTAGSLPPNPQELLMRPSLSKLISDATSVYDVVIVDTPPAGQYADAQVIACRTGSSLMVTRANRTDGLRLRRVMTSLRDSGANVIGSVMNDG
jgi:protein-tyrosine kinase